jgi:hypothetical protein
LSLQAKAIVPVDVVGSVPDEPHAFRWRDVCPSKWTGRDFPHRFDSQQRDVRTTRGDDVANRPHPQRVIRVWSKRNACGRQAVLRSEDGDVGD